MLVNTHATFRWRHGLFAAFDFDQIKAFNADLYITLLDNAESVHQRLMRDHDIDHTLKDIMVWREEELLATEILANILRGYGHFFMISRGRNIPTTQTIYRLMFEHEEEEGLSVSFPMSHVMDLPDTLAEIDAFQRRAERALHRVRSRRRGRIRPAHDGAESDGRKARPRSKSQAADGPVTLKTAEVAQISGDIMGQIYARDFKMVDQTDMIVSLVPELPNGKPGLQQRRRARTAPRLRRRQRSLRRLGLPRHAEPVHHRDRDAGVQEHGGSDGAFQNTRLHHLTLRNNSAGAYRARSLWMTKGRRPSNHFAWRRKNATRWPQ